MSPALIPAESFEPGVFPCGVRKAALFEGSSANYGTTLWSPSTPAAEFEFTFTTTSATEQQVIGRNQAGRLRFIVKADGAFELRNSNTFVTEIAGVVLFDGEPHTYRIVLGADTQLIERDDVVMGQDTAVFSFSTAAASFHIGTTGASSAGATGTLWNVKLIDPADDTNTAEFKLDGNFLNTHPGSTVADATPTGFIGWAKVTGDSGRPVRAGRAEYLHSGSATAFVIDGTNASPYIKLDTIDLNETGGLNADSLDMWTAPADGTVEVSVMMVWPANADPADPAKVRLQRDNVIIIQPEVEVGTRDAGTLPLLASHTISAGESARVRMSQVAVTTDITVDVQYTLSFYPS